MNVGIVAEGPSDQILLGRIAEALHPSWRVTRIQPEPTLGKIGSGWTGVRNWCAEFGPKLDTFMQADPGNPLDLLLIHVDCSMAHNVAADRPCPPGADTAAALEDVVIRAWLGLTAKPAWLVVATPSMSSDTWIAAVVAPPPPALGPLECIPPPQLDGHLVARRILRRKAGGRTYKPGRAYEVLAERAVAALPELRVRCPEADRLCAQL